MESVLIEMCQANMDFGVFQETKLTDGIYTRVSARYRFVAMPAPRRHRGDVAMFYWNSPNFSVEVIHQFGAKVSACQLAIGERR